MFYRLRNIEAVQFDSEAPPEEWPAGVTEGAESPTGYWFDGLGGVRPITPGDYVVVRGAVPRLMGPADFEQLYEPAE